MYKYFIALFFIISYVFFPQSITGKVTVKSILLDPESPQIYKTTTSSGLGISKIKFIPDTFPFIADVSVEPFNEKINEWYLKDKLLDGIILSGNLEFVAAISHQNNGIDVPGKAFIYTYPKGEILLSKQLNIAGRIYISDDSTTVAIEDQENKIFIYSLIDGNEIYQLPKAKYFAITSDGMMSSLIIDNTLNLYSKNKLLASENLSTSYIRGVDNAAKSTTAVTYWKNGFLYVSHDKKIKETVNIKQTQEILGATCDPYGTSVIIAVITGDDRFVDLYHWKSGKELKLIYQLIRKRPVNSIEWIDCTSYGIPDVIFINGGYEATWINAQEVINE